MRLLGWFLLAAASLYGAAALYLFVAQERLIFLGGFGGRSLLHTPTDVGLSYDDVHLTLEDGIHIHGWYVPHPDASTHLIYFHGNAGNIGARVNSIERWHKLGVSVLIVDYPGYGQSTGKTTEAGTYESARAAWRFLTQTKSVAAQDIVLFGRSLGGGVATQLATEVNAKALIIESTFTSVPDVAAEVYWFLPVKKLARVKFNSGEKIKDIKMPVLVAHSPQDEVIPYAHGLRLFELANEPKDLPRNKRGTQRWSHPLRTHVQPKTEGVLSQPRPLRQYDSALCISRIYRCFGYPGVDTPRRCEPLSISGCYLLRHLLYFLSRVPILLFHCALVTLHFLHHSIGFLARLRCLT